MKFFRKRRKDEDENGPQTEENTRDIRTVKDWISSHERRLAEVRKEIALDLETRRARGGS